eukprot:1798350-Pleurochrysis_carterae.AAC.1
MAENACLDTWLKTAVLNLLNNLCGCVRRTLHSESALPHLCLCARMLRKYANTPVTSREGMHARAARASACRMRFREPHALPRAARALCTHACPSHLFRRGTWQCFVETPLERRRRSS